MNPDAKNQYIEQYIKNVSNQVNTRYGKILIDNDKINRALSMFMNSDGDLQTEIVPKINDLVKQVVDNYIELQRQLEEMMRRHQEEQLQELATLKLETPAEGIYLSQQQVDLLMITELESKADLQNYVENICGQFPDKSIEEVIPEFNTLGEENLEQLKRDLYDKYQDGLIGYIDNEMMTDTEKAKVKLERLGITGAELDMCLANVSNGKINETFNYLGEKYGDDFVTKFNRTMNDDFENIKGVSYDEMQSLSKLINNGAAIDTIVIATGKYDNSVYQTMNGKVFDPYLTTKGLNYCAEHGKHMRYHALFDQAHVENLLKQGKGLEDHDQILADMKAYVKMSMDYIEKNNKEMPDGSKLINTVEVFNELVEKNKTDKNMPYEMVWEKHFGITVDEMVSCFDGIKKPDGVDFMYNETTLTESPEKRACVEKVLYQIESKNPNLVDSFGDQMHLSDEDVMTKVGRENVRETAKMLKRVQDGKINVDGEVKEIKGKKIECTEHDFHYTEHFLEDTKKLQQSGENIDLWAVKRGMQSYVSDEYNAQGVKFEKATYWNTFGQNDHNLARTNKAIARENKEREQKGMEPKPYVETQYAGLVPDGKTLDSVKSLKNDNANKLSMEKANLQKMYNDVKVAKETSINENQNEKGYAYVYKPNNKKNPNNNNNANNNGVANNGGYASALIVTLLTGFVGGMIATILYLFTCK